MPLLLVLALLGPGYYFCALVIYPKVMTVSETYHGEAEQGKIVEAEYEAWEKEEVRLASVYGYELYGQYFPLPGAHKTVVIAHGITFSLYGSVKYMPLYRKRGFNILIYDHRNHGRSGGKNSTFGVHEKYDLKLWVDWAFQRLGADGQVGVMGESFGSATMLQYAALPGEAERLAFLVSDCSFSDLSRLLAFRIRADYHLPAFPWIPLASLWARLLAGFWFSQASPLAAVQSLPPALPIFFAHGQNDAFTPCWMSEELFAAAQSRGSQTVQALFLGPNADHAEAYWNNQAEYDRRLGEFLTAIALAAP